MSRTIVGYAIPRRTTGDVAVLVHEGMHPLSLLNTSRTGLVLSAIADTTRSLVPLVFRVLTSGAAVPDMAGFRFLSSCEVGGGLIIYHVFVRMRGGP